MELSYEQILQVIGSQQLDIHALKLHAKQLGKENQDLRQAASSDPAPKTVGKAK